MNVIYTSPITIDNSKERGNLLGFCRSFYWRLSRDFRKVKRDFVSCSDGFELRTEDRELFTRALLVLDLASVTFTYYSFLGKFVVLVKEF